MNESWAQEVCAQANTYLSPPPSDPMEPGGAFDVRGVSFELLHDSATGALVLVALLKPVEEEHRAEVYQQMLYIQMLAWQSAVVRFGFDPSRDIPVLFSALPPRAECDGRWLAGVIEAMADQVNDWNETLLAGKMVLQPDDGDATGPGAGFAPMMASATA